MTDPFDEALNEGIESSEDVDIDNLLFEEFEDDKEEHQKDKELYTEHEDKNIDELVVAPDTKKEDLPEIHQEMFNVIQETDRSAWEKGEGIQCKFDKLVEKMNGIQPGLGFVGAQSNVGKSGFLLSVGYSATKHDDVYSLYFSLDDSARDLLPRIVSSDKKIPINAIRMPQTFSEYPEILKRRKQGIEELYNSVDRFKMLDQNYGGTIEYIKEAIKNHYEYVEEHTDKKLFVQIDNFHDIHVEGENFYGDDNAKYGYIGKELNDLAENLQIPIWCTAELRKSANNQRPTFDDIKAAGKLGYLAKICLMCYNEVGVDKGNAEVYYINEDRPGKSPIFEVDFNKNKLSTFKGKLYYEFVPEYGLYSECSEEDIEKYNNKVYQD